MRKLIVFLLLLAVVLIILDRVAVAGVQREVSRQVAARYRLDAAPTVTIEGIPFLTQAVAGRYDAVRLEIGRLTERGVELSDVTATLHGVNAPLTQLLQDPVNVQITVERVTGSVVIPRETIERRAPRGVKVSGDGEALTVSGEFLVNNVRIPVRATMEVEVVEGGVRLSPRKVTVAGGISVPPDVTRSLTYTIPIRDLPLNLEITGVRSVPDGLQVTGEAEDVPLR
ncbi:DUF2993 domain-containing protein [Thermostaphylospora chromogena]|uniref:DUF2993 domain-containing protein n=1 Tax=Thermostaphylospora chromogena TaxID=35622 RepID=A0A1H1DUU8_9ACTN|nr:DUF2993 domain-containing protein [Thermostaphylospora chromogena]SDQ80291.1 Protein of unknown function [Thermostaphylospora chromogena]